jgi:hypothetical protein
MMPDVQPTQGRIAEKITCREDARAVAESLMPFRDDNRDPFFETAAHNILTEVIVSLNLMFPRIWSLRNLASIVSQPFALRIFLQRTAEGRELLDRYFAAPPSGVTRAIIAILRRCLD